MEVTECEVLFAQSYFTGLESRGSVTVDIIRVGNAEQKCTVQFSSRKARWASFVPPGPGWCPFFRSYSNSSM